MVLLSDDAKRMIPMRDKLQHSLDDQLLILNPLILILKFLMNVDLRAFQAHVLKVQLQLVGQ